MTRTQDGIHLTTHVENKFLHEGMNARNAREKLQRHLQDVIDISDSHLRMWARLLDANSTFLDPEYVKEMQSHWNGVQPEVAAQSKISFIVPCLRLRWRYVRQPVVTLFHRDATFDQNFGRSGDRRAPRKGQYVCQMWQDGYQEYVCQVSLSGFR